MTSNELRKKELLFHIDRCIDVIAKYKKVFEGVDFNNVMDDSIDENINVWKRSVNEYEEFTNEYFTESKK